jgi:hypothetical protein
MPAIVPFMVVVLALVAIAVLAWRQAVAREVATLRRRQRELASCEAQVAEHQALAHDLSGPRPAKLEARRQAQEAHELAAAVDHELRLAERALLVGRLGKARDASRRVARDEALLAEALEGATAAMRSLRDDRRGVARTLGEATSLLAYMRGRVAKLAPGLAKGLSEALDAVEHDLAEARALLAAGEPAHALMRARSVRLALVAARRALMRRTAACAYLIEVPGQVARLEAEAERLHTAGFIHLPKIHGDALRERAAALAKALDDGDVRALEREAALRAEILRLQEQLGRFEALHHRNAEAIARLHRDLAELTSRSAALLPPDADRFARAHRRPVQHMRDRVDGRLRSLNMALRAAESDNHKDVQRFTEASLRLATLEREAVEAQRELAKAELRWRRLLVDEQRLRERLARLAEEVAQLDAVALSLGMRPDPGVAALLGAARDVLADEPLSLEDGARALDGLFGAAEAYRERLRRLDDRLQPRPGQITMYPHRQEARLPGRDPEH